MKDIDEKTIAKLVSEALQNVPGEDIYAMALKYMDFEAIKKSPPSSEDELGILFTTAGFATGIEFSLRYLDVTDDEETDVTHEEQPKEEPKTFTVVREEEPPEEPRKVKVLIEEPPEEEPRVIRLKKGE